jgi:nitronate monooxygenase
MTPSWPRTRLTDLLGIEVPVVSAGMGGGITAPALVAAISNAGALGNIGAGYLPPDVIREEIRAVRALTARPFAVNLMAHQRVRPLAALDAELNDQLDAVEAEGVPVFTFTYGVPPLDRIVRLRRAGAVVIGTATTVGEAAHLAGLGVDAVVAQGAEAAGTRASFLSPFSAAMVGTMALVPQVVDAIDDVPVIAAGGIGDGRGVAAARMLGADGVQLGTAFLVAQEASTPQPVKDAALRAGETDTVVTAAIHGRPGRG